MKKVSLFVTKALENGGVLTRIEVLGFVRLVLLDISQSDLRLGGQYGIIDLMS